MICLALTSCGWRMAPSCSSDKHLTLSIPYVEGDPSGSLTAALSEQVEKRSGFSYVSGEGDLTLKVRLTDSKTDNIGFRHDPSKKLDGRQKLLPNESRKRILAEVSVINSATGQLLLGPLCVKASVDYDHQHYALDNSINIFSLGQLTDMDTCRDGLVIPAHRALAKEITDILVMHMQELHSNYR